MKPWDRRDNEGLKAYRAFRIYLGMGPKRSLRRVAGKLDRTLRQMEKWSSDHQWIKRVGAYESYALSKAIESRIETQEKVRQIIIDRAHEAADVMFELLFGGCNVGDKIAKLDRDGNIIGYFPIVKAGTRLQAAAKILEFAGITVPKRVELSGPDGKDLLISARAAISQLNDEQIDALSQVFSIKSDENDDE